MDPSPRTVSRFEYQLLRLLRYFFGAMPAEQAKELVAQEYASPPPCLTRTCLDLVQETLAKGTVQYLVRAGGWRHERFLREGQPRDGRAWERWTLDERALHFGPHPVGFLMWLTAVRPGRSARSFAPPVAELTTADQLFFALVLEALSANTFEDTVPALVTQAYFQKNPLAWLLTPWAFWATGADAAPDFAPCFEGQYPVVLECLQPVLAERWTRTERSKAQVADWRRMRGIGTAERAALSGFLGAAERAGRPDLARFLLRAGRATFGQPGQTAASYTGGLQSGSPQRLADKLATQRLALTVPEQFLTLARWTREAQSVGYFDDSYAASQFWKAEWDAYDGSALARRAGELMSSLDPLRA